MLEKCVKVKKVLLGSVELDDSTPKWSPFDDNFKHLPILPYPPVYTSLLRLYELFYEAEEHISSVVLCLSAKFTLLWEMACTSIFKIQL